MGERVRGERYRKRMLLCPPCPTPTPTVAEKTLFFISPCDQLLTKSLEVVDFEEWTAELGEAFGSQVGHYANCPQEKVSGESLS